MSWKDQFKRYKGEWDKFNSKHNILPGSQGQQQQQQPPQYSYPPQQYPPQGQYPQTPPPPGQQQQQSLYNRPPPPGPQGQYGFPPPPQPGYNPQSQSHPLPPQQPINPVYWQARFEPGAPVTQEWDAKQGNNNGWGNNELENYTSNPENAFYTQDGKLIVRAISNNNHPDPAHKYTSARLVSRQRLARDRGVLTAVITSPCASGIWPAFWLLPFEPFTWPGDGEVDIMETWNGDRTNHSCLHWGKYDGADWNKHITQMTQLHDMDRRPVRYDLTWDQPNGQPGQGRLIWHIDGRPVMKAPIPQGSRPMRDFTILFNVAMGGNVCAGQIPRDGAYDMVVHYCAMSAEPEGGWARFENDWRAAPDGKVG
ncbi:hypothetical protein PMZ80_002506 [Knufia obscura]|uniref:GH16 domain-containing protein n=2 Tax=Knufia TaxID=430999 RepID=A0AAN8ECB7_9EURO|nr:hypothetical protein PMZ80_002506 [Knufia obscura]KAK5950785.1 hypothetical protein OHC33_008168 [Knufia fluminis]